jgi:uncharacterized protein with von Willebrand factor type A (vWA) domain
MSNLFPDRWKRPVDPDKLSKEVIDTDRWDREDRDRMINEVAPFAAARRKIDKFAPTGGAAMNDMFTVFLKAEPEALDPSQVRPSHLVNLHIMEQAQDLDVTEQLRRYTVNDDVQSALSCETIEPELETLLDMTEQQRLRAQELEEKLRQLAKAQQDQHDVDEMVRKQMEEAGVEPCETCDGTGRVPDPDAQSGEEGSEEGAEDGAGDGEGDAAGESAAPSEGGGEDPGGDQEGGSGHGHGQGAGTVPCPDCGGTGCQPQGQGAGEGEGEGGEGQGGQGGEGTPGDGNTPPSDGTPGKATGNNEGGTGRGKYLTEQQKKQMEAWAQAQSDAADAVEKARKEAEAAGENLDDAMNSNKAQVRSQIQQMLNKAADEAQAANETALTWGMEPGELHRLPAEERMELAKRLNNPKFKRVAELFGPMRNMMLSEQQRKTVHTPEEVYDVTLGNNIGRLLPQEIMMLSNPLTRLDFYRRFSEAKVLEYDMQGVEKLAKGAIIFCEDGSGSMSGEREMWAKAVMLCLLHLSRIQKREMHVIHFSSRGQTTHIPFTKPEDYTLNRILDAAELFYGGGTDFQTPMQLSMDLLKAEHAATGRVSADVVFVTDDECYVTDDFMTEYLDTMHKVGSTTWGISVSGADRREGALDTMTEGKVAVIADFYSGNEIRDMFRGV